MDEQGRPRSDAAWTISDTSLATITTDSSPTLTAMAVGQVTLTANVQSATVQVQVNILGGASLPPGTVLWSAPPVPGFTTRQIIQAVPTAGNTPDLYGISTDGSGNVLIRALSSGGLQMWQANASPSDVSPTVVSPDGFGGVLVTSTSGVLPYITTTVSDRDAATGTQVWSYSTLAEISTKAIRQDGAVFHIETTAPDVNNFNSTSSSLVAVDGTAGAPLLRVPLPSTTVKVVDCNGVFFQKSTSGPGTSNLEIDSDGTVSVAIDVDSFTTNFNCDSSISSAPFTSTLSLFQLKPDGSTSLTPIHTNTEDLNTATTGRVPRATPWQVIPDGQGGSLVAWTDYSFQQPPDYITHIGPSGQNDYPFPSLSQTIDSMVLGDNGAAYATDSQTIQAFTITSGQPLWTYVSQALDGIAILASTSGGGLLTKEFSGVQTGTTTQLDANGNPSPVTTTPTPGLPSFSWRGGWYGILSDPLPAQIVLPIAQNFASPWAEPAGSPSEIGAAGAMCDCLTETTDPEPPPSPVTCPICNLSPPQTSTTSCIIFSGSQPTFILLVGDAGLPGHDDGNLFNLAAQTQANNLQAKGNNVVGCRVSSIQDVYYALTNNGNIDGGVYYFGHSGIRQEITSGQPPSQTTNLFVGQEQGPDTNITAQNVSYLKPIQTANGGGNFLGQNAAMWINGCQAALTIFDTSYNGYVSIAQLISVNLNRGVYAYDVGMYFSQLDAQHDKNITGNGRHPPNALPMYMVPEGAPGHKPNPLACRPTGGYCSEQ